MTAEQIQKFLTTVFGCKAQSLWYSKKDRIVSFRVSDAPVNYDTLSVLAEAFGTKNINLEGDSSEGGCDSCDYGASKWVEVVVNEITKELP